MAKILIAGCGDVGCKLAEQLIKEEHQVWGLRRNTEQLPDFINPIKADLTDLSQVHLPEKFDFVFYTAGATSLRDDTYKAVYVTGIKNLLELLKREQQNPQRIFYTSSTTVYAQDTGEWVDETSATEPTKFSGVRILQGEQLLKDSPFNCTIVRCAGIYGPGRMRLASQLREGRCQLSRRAIYTNRIHRDDVVGVLFHLMNLTNPDDLYIAVDKHPTLLNILYIWLADKLRAPHLEFADDVDEAFRSTKGSKRCSNKKLIDSGYEFKYPSFREGYLDALMNNELI